MAAPRAVVRRHQLRPVSGHGHVAPVWGTLADRYGRKPMVVRAMASGRADDGLFIVAPNVWCVLLLRILQGILTGSVSASQALVASVTPREKMAFSMGMMQSAVFSGAAIGPFVGGYCNDHLGFHGTFLAARRCCPSAPSWSCCSWTRSFNPCRQGPAAASTPTPICVISPPRQA